MILKLVYKHSVYTHMDWIHRTMRSNIEYMQCTHEWIQKARIIFMANMNKKL